MNFLKALWKMASEPPGPGSDFWYQDVSPMSSAGVQVNNGNALQIASVYSCVKVLAESIASLPICIYRQLPEGGKEEAPDHPLAQLLKFQPNGYQTKFNLFQMMVGHLALRGNFYSRKLFGPDGQVQSIIPLNPARMTTELLPNYSLRFKYTNDSGQPVPYNQGDIFRVNNLSDDGIKGFSVIEKVRDTFGGAMQTQEYANRFFANDARPGGVLSSDKPVDEKVRDANRTSWEKAHRGAKNAHKVAILYGLTWQQVGMSNEDSQFLETRKFGRSEICGLFGVPPHMIGDLERATFSNIENQDIGFYKHTIRPWLVNIEQAIKRDLILEDDIFVEFKIDGLLRGDANSRSAYFQKALGAGNSPAWMTPNEVRALENLNPIEGGDDLPKPIQGLNQAQNQQNKENKQDNGSDTQDA